MTREEREDAIDIIQSILNKYEEDECLVTEITIGDEDIKAFKMAIKALELEPKIVPIAEIKFDEDKLKELVNKAVLTVTQQEPCEDAISRKSIKQKLQEHHDFFVNAYSGFSNLPQNDKSRVDEITNCIAMVVNEPPVTPQEPFKPMVEIDPNSVIKQDIIDRYKVESEKKRASVLEIARVLDKIRAEINDIAFDWQEIDGEHESFMVVDLNDTLNILDKYKAESEEV